MYLTRKSYLFTDHCCNDLGPRLWHRWTLDTCRRVIRYVVLGSLGRHGSKRRTPIPKWHSVGGSGYELRPHRVQFFINRPLRRRQLNILNYQTKLSDQIQPTENQMFHIYDIILNHGLLHQSMSQT